MSCIEHPTAPSDALGDKLAGVKSELNFRLPHPAFTGTPSLVPGDAGR